VLFIDEAQPQGSEESRIWKNLSDAEVEPLRKGMRVQLVPSGTDKSGKAKHTILLLETLPLPPGSMGLPLLGETMSFIRDPHFLEKRQNLYGQLFKSHIFGQPTIFLMGAEALQFIFSRESQHFVVKLPGTFEHYLEEILCLYRIEKYILIIVGY